MAREEMHARTLKENDIWVKLFHESYKIKSRDEQKMYYVFFLLKKEKQKRRM